jgi:ubiquinone/menaquinone biosynthesis C-methylase UbiE
MFPRVAASFDALPLPRQSYDIAVFNAALHYALDLKAVLAEAARVLQPGGRIVVLDSPFYKEEAEGLAMLAEKQRGAQQQFGERARDLMALPFVEFLTRERLAAASSALQLTWRHERVRYPFWYEVRPMLARLRGQRAPSRFDLWEAVVP